MCNALAARPPRPCPRRHGAHRDDRSKETQARVQWLCPQRLGGQAARPSPPAPRPFFLPRRRIMPGPSPHPASRTLRRSFSPRHFDPPRLFPPPHGPSHLEETFLQRMGTHGTPGHVFTWWFWVGHHPHRSFLNVALLASPPRAFTHPTPPTPQDDKRRQAS